MNNLYDLLTGSKAAFDISIKALLLHILNEVLGYLIVNVSFEKSHSDLLHHILNISFGYACLAAHGSCYILKLC